MRGVVWDVFGVVVWEVFNEGGGLEGFWLILHLGDCQAVYTFFVCRVFQMSEVISKVSSSFFYCKQKFCFL